MPVVAGGRCPKPDLYILSHTGERDDDVGPYGKSLLYLVSNAFEGRRDTPILGMERHIKADSEVAAFLRDHIVIAGGAGAGSDDNYPLSRSNSHGGFDDDPATMNSLMWRILGTNPARKFTVRDLQY
jgi:hypothetical protein